MNVAPPPRRGADFVGRLLRPRVAASFWDPPGAERLARMRADGLEIVEARLDLAAEQTEESGRAILSAARFMPSILTIRPEWEGGNCRIGEDDRRELFRRLSPFASAVDIELAAAIRPRAAAAAKRAGAAAIFSRHNFSAVDSPKEMDAAAARAFAEGGDVFKIACKVGGAGDFAALESFLLRWRRRPVVVIGMGDSEFARRARLEFPAKGSRIAFAAADAASAPGQLSLAETAAAVRAFTDATDAK